eukprot:scaffold1444_cov134-Isochrysis_galbana.AAC.2
MPTPAPRPAGAGTCMTGAGPARRRSLGGGIGRLLLHRAQILIVARVPIGVEQVEVEVYWASGKDARRSAIFLRPRLRLVRVNEPEQVLAIEACEPAGAGLLEHGE